MRTDVVEVSFQIQRDDWTEALRRLAELSDDPKLDRIAIALDGATAFEVTDEDALEADFDCQGHEPDPAMPNQTPGQTFYCDSSCRQGRRPW